MDQAACLFVALVSFGLSAFAGEPEAVPGEYIVKLKQPMTSTQASTMSLGRRLGGTIKSVLAENGMVVIKKSPLQTSYSVAKTLGEDPLVEYIEPNYIYHINKTPNDPMLGQLWGMNNTKTAGIDIGALQAWDIETGSKDVLVAVIDTGLNYNHPDLKDNAWVNVAELNGQAGIDDDGNGVIDDIHGFNAIDGSGDPMDDHGHGSHCSGTIGARGDDGQGLVGVNWNVRIMGAKFLDANGSGTLENAIKAIDYATKMGAKIMSNSWGGGTFSQALFDAIQRASDAGVLFVAAAGNESNDNDANPSYPASYNTSNMIAVAAVDDEGKMASFSNWGKTKVHVGAPGVNITSSITGVGYDTWSGTSMATPHVSGVAALLLAHEPTLTNIELRDRLTTTAKPISSLRNRVRSGGLVNAFNALTNTIPGPDMNDPIHWQSVSSNISSPHPYTENFAQTYSVNVPDAKQIAIYFEKFETEGRYDTVTIKDSTGKVVDTLSGALDDSYSAVIDGDSATIEFKSDGTVNKNGFDITKVMFR